jgi:hypothetical protein
MTERPSVSKIALKYGLISGVFMALFSVILSMLQLDLEQQSFYGKGGYLILIVAIVLALLEYRKIYEGLVYSKGVKLGTWVSFYAGLISSVYTYIYLKFIDHSLIEMIRDAQLAAMEDQEMSDAQIEQSMQIMNMVMVPGCLAIMAFIFYIILGFIFSLVLSAIFQKKPLETDPFDV